MNTKKAWYKLFFLLMIFFVVFFISSCVSTKGTTSWVEPAYNGGPLKKIAVIGVFRKLSSRREFENEVSKLINAKSGTKAIPSLDFMPPNVEYQYKNMENQFKEMGIDGVLIMRTKSIDRQTNYIPGRSYTVKTGHPVYYYDFPYYYKYYVYTYETIREPGYYEETFIVSNENVLFRNSDDKMIWMLEKQTTQRYNTADGITNPTQEAVRSASLIFDSLSSNNLLLPK